MGTRAKMSDRADRMAEHIDALGVFEGQAGRPRSYMSRLAEREARAILAETEPDSKLYCPAWAMVQVTLGAQLNSALAESLAAFVQS